jgi:hypothetical protein
MSLTPHQERVAFARAIVELADAFETGELPADHPGISTARTFVALADSGRYSDPSEPRDPPKSPGPLPPLPIDANAPPQSGPRGPRPQTAPYFGGP